MDFVQIGACCDYVVYSVASKSCDFTALWLFGFVF